MKIDLIWLTDEPAPPEWPLGKATLVSPEPAAISASIHSLINTLDADACLFWDAALGQPDEARIEEMVSQPGDAWHAGLKLGLTGKPGLVDFIQPAWMLNRDASVDIPSTSWRVSLRACLVRTSVIKQIGLPDPNLKTLAAAGLDWGLRMVNAGVITRYIPDLYPGEVQPPEILPLADEARVIYKNWNKFWTRWALWMAVKTGYCSFPEAVQAARSIFREKRDISRPGYSHSSPGRMQGDGAKVSVLIPTLQRYPYLRVLLDQFRFQTVKPCEIIVVDQTPPDERDTGLLTEFADQPLKVIYLDTAGQCTARNAGLKAAAGEYIFFVDDDVEIKPTTIAEHVEILHAYNADVSAGTVHEPGQDDLSRSEPQVKVSFIFPTDNAMIRKDLLSKTGLFDLAYDHGARADGDLGMRLYLSGALMLQNLSNDILHHHAPRGGLRVHGARGVTAQDARVSFSHANVPSATEFYLAKRYFSLEQVRNIRWIMTFATLRSDVKGFRRILHLLIRLAQFPGLYARIRKNEKTADSMMKEYPVIPSLE